MDSLFNFVLTCGLIIAGTTGHSLPFENEVKTLQDHYKLTGPEWVGKAVFSRYLGKVDDTCTCEKLALLGMLNVYTDIFSDMMNKSKDKKAILEDLLKHVAHLKMNKYAKEQAVLKQLKEIGSIEVTNSTIQGGALNNFRSVFEVASTAGQQMKKV